MERGDYYIVGRGTRYTDIVVRGSWELVGRRGVSGGGRGDQEGEVWNLGAGVEVEVVVGVC